MSSNTDDLANPEMAAAVEQDSKERKRDRDEQALEAESTLQQISQRRSEKTVHVRIEGDRVPFEPLKGALSEIEDYFLDLSGVDEENLTDEQAAQYREGRDRLVEILAEKCKDPASTEAFWREEFGPEEQQDILNDLAEGGVEGNDADGFREE